jgi:hypothetical protein
MKKRILVDVDGVLNFDDTNQYSIDTTVIIGDREYLLRLDPRHGQWLLELAEETDSELWWATTWLELANEHIGPKIGLPELPYVNFGRKKYSQSVGDWKGTGVAEKVKDPFLWFDDDFTIPSVLQHFDVPKHTVRLVHERTGLSRADIDFARKWLLDL